jgi:hypothetical protein
MGGSLLHDRVGPLLVALASTARIPMLCFLPEHAEALTEPKAATTIHGTWPSASRRSRCRSASANMATWVAAMDPAGTAKLSRLDRFRHRADQHILRLTAISGIDFRGFIWRCLSGLAEPAVGRVNWDGLAGRTEGIGATSVRCGGDRMCEGHLPGRRHTVGEPASWKERWFGR